MNDHLFTDEEIEKMLGEACTKHIVQLLSVYMISAASDDEVAEDNVRRGVKRLLRSVNKAREIIRELRDAEP